MSSRRTSIALATCLLSTALASVALAHHILGIPHYAYDESYPQAPVITYAVEAGPYLMKVTGYPGKPGPGELAQVHAYVVRADDATAVYGGRIDARLEKDELLGSRVVWGPAESLFEGNLHKVSPRFGGEGRYRLRLELELEGRPYEIDFPMAVGDPGSPTALLAAWAGALSILVVVVRALRIKLERRRAGAAGA